MNNYQIMISNFIYKLKGPDFFKPFTLPQLDLYMFVDTLIDIFISECKTVVSACLFND